MANYHGSKEEVINLIPHGYLIDIIYKILKPSNLGNLQIIQNVIKLLFQVISTFSEWILVEQIIASSTPSILEETDFQKILPGVLSGTLGRDWKCIYSMLFLGMLTP